MSDANAVGGGAAIAKIPDEIHTRTVGAVGVQNGQTVVARRNSGHKIGAKRGTGHYFVLKIAAGNANQNPIAVFFGTNAHHKNTQIGRRTRKAARLPINAKGISATQHVVGIVRDAPVDR